MSSVYDNVDQWVITVEGVTNLGEPLVGVRAAITKEMFELAKFPVNEHEFNLLWQKIMEKSKNISIEEARG